MKTLFQSILILGILITQCLNINAQIVITGLDSGIGSLRSEINSANSGDIIVFSDLVTEINLNTEIVIDKDITILGLVDLNTEINANSQSRIFNITSGNVTLSNLTLINGLAENGGAIYNSGALTINDCHLKNNVANGSSGSGGAVFNATGGTFVAN